MSTFLSTSTWLNENRILPKIKLRNRPSTAIGDWHYKLGSSFYSLYKDRDAMSNLMKRIGKANRNLHYIQMNGSIWHVIRTYEDLLYCY